MKEKILLVGDVRICPQVAYVMDWQNYAMVEQLTDAAQYHDYKIVVCAFKKKSKRLVKVKDKTLDIIYLDDICHELDAQDAATQGELTLLNSMETKPVPLWRRVIDRIKTGEVRLAILRRRRRRRRSNIPNFKIVNRLPIEILRLSELFIKVIYSKPINAICNRLETACYISYDSKVKGCCLISIPFGVINQNGLEDVYHSIRARIIRLSSVNKSLCLCNHKICEYSGRYLTVTNHLNRLPTYLELGIDRSCNLACPQCRNEHFVESELTGDQLRLIKNISDKWLNNVPNLRLAGAGEVFYSKTYSHLLANVLQRDQIQILSNGTLFDSEKFEKLKIYQNIDVMISVDAATAATYQKLRGGDFKQLVKNLEMLGELRVKGKIRWFESNYIVQRDNYTEMVEFVYLAKKLHMDRVHFMMLNNYGAFTKREYRKKCLIIRHR